MQKTLLTFLLSMAPIFLLAQTFSGQIIDAKTNTSLAYVNIGVVGKNIGTVSSPDGTFSLGLSPNLDPAELKISMVGYESLSFSVSEFKKKIKDNPKISLSPTSVELDEVVVMPKFTETIILGNTTTSTNFSAGFSIDSLGKEAGVKIKLKKKYRPAQILKFRTSIASSDYDTIRFRLNFYDLKRGKPTEKIVQENIIVTSTVKSGVIEVDLEDYQILVEDDFCVTLEWIENLWGKNLNFSSRLGGAKFIYRHTSHGTWQDFRIFSLGFNVELGY